MAAICRERGRLFEKREHSCLNKSKTKVAENLAKPILNAKKVYPYASAFRARIPQNHLGCLFRNYYRRTVRIAASDGSIMLASTTPNLQLLYAEAP